MSIYNFIIIKKSVFFPALFYFIFFTKSLQSCPTLCDPIDGSTPGFPIPGILQARTLEWIAIGKCYGEK